MLVWRWLLYMGCWCGGGCFKWHGVVLLCASEEVVGLILVAGMAVAALYGMLVWRWLPYMGCWCGGRCLIWDAGEAMAAWNGMELYFVLVRRWLASYWMLVWRWLPYIGCWFGSGSLNGMLEWRWLPYIGCWFGGGSLLWDAGRAVAALNGIELYYYVLVRRWLALYWMLVWWWLPYMGCWCGGGCFKWHGVVLLCASGEVSGLASWAHKKKRPLKRTADNRLPMLNSSYSVHGLSQQEPASQCDAGPHQLRAYIKRTLKGHQITGYQC